MGVRHGSNIKLVKRSGIVSATASVIIPPSVREKIEAQATRISDIDFEFPTFKLNQAQFREILATALENKLYNPKLWEKGQINIVLPVGAKIGRSWNPQQFDISLYQKGKKSESSVTAHIEMQREYVGGHYVQHGTISNIHSEKLPAGSNKSADPRKALAPEDKQRLQDLLDEFSRNPKCEKSIDTGYYKPSYPTYWHIYPYVEDFLTKNVFQDTSTSRKLMTNGYNLGGIVPNNPAMANLTNADAEKYSHFVIYRKYQKHKTQLLLTVKAVKDSSNAWNLSVIGVEPH